MGNNKFKHGSGLLSRNLKISQVLHMDALIGSNFNVFRVKKSSQYELNLILHVSYQFHIYISFLHLCYALRRGYVYTDAQIENTGKDQWLRHSHHRNPSFHYICFLPGCIGHLHRQTLKPFPHSRQMCYLSHLDPHTSVVLSLGHFAHRDPSHLSSSLMHWPLAHRKYPLGQSWLQRPQGVSSLPSSHEPKVSPSHLSPGGMHCPLAHWKLTPPPGEQSKRPFSLYFTQVLHKL